MFRLVQKSVLDQKIEDSETGEVVNLVSDLEFSGNLDESLETHASKQVYWETLAAEVSRKAQEFENVGYAKWMAHARYYAKLVLKGQGEERVLLDDIRDMTVRAYSKDTSEAQREEFCRYAFHAYLCLQRGGVRAAEKFKTDSKYTECFKTFKEEMFSYLRAVPPWYYETIQATLYNIKEESEKIKSIARAFDKRSYSMREFVELEKAKFGNIGPISIDGIIDEISKRVEKRLGVVDEKGLMESLRKPRRI
jgi:hypothetical protein